MFNLVAAMSQAMDMVSPLVMDHHRRTAWYAVKIAEKMGLDKKSCKEILLSALLHDIGAFSLKERIDTLKFEFENPHHHACLGYSLLKDIEALNGEAKIILAHHTWWKPEHDDDVGGELVPIASHVIHLADRVAILVKDNGHLEQMAAFALDRVKNAAGSMFMPDAVDGLVEAAREEGFWSGSFQVDVEDRLRHRVDGEVMEDVTWDLLPLARVFARIIDYRSHFTATHSAGVAVIAENLARYLGFSEDNCETMKVAGYLHDLGKIALPAEILDKSGNLDSEEYHRIQDHVLYTRKLLENMPELGHGIRWASEHHERLNGSGYPMHSAGDEIAFGSRVVAMADVFTALTEDRPYRKGVERRKALALLRRLTDEGYLDPEIFKVVEENFDELNRARAVSQLDSSEDYRISVECFEREQ